jgi:hypothetical protein
VDRRVGTPHIHAQESSHVFHARQTTLTVIPFLRYRNAPAMIDWPCKAFGFEKHAVDAESDVLQHAQLAFGNDMYHPWAEHAA